METVRDREMFWIENYTTNFNTTTTMVLDFSAKKKTTMVLDLWVGFEHVTAEN